MAQSSAPSNPAPQAFLREFEERVSTKHERLRRARTPSAHVSSWQLDPESEILWRLYCPKADDGPTNQGMEIVLETTYATVKGLDALPDVYISSIIFRPYDKGEAFTYQFAHLMHEREGFSAECRFDGDSSAHLL